MCEKMQKFQNMELRKVCDNVNPKRVIFFALISLYPTAILKLVVTRTVKVIVMIT